MPKDATKSEAHRRASARLDADKAAHAKRAESPVVKKAMRVAAAQANVEKAKKAQKAAHAKLKPRGLFSKLKAGIKALTPGNNARSERIKKITGIPTDLDKVRAKVKKKMKEIGL